MIKFSTLLSGFSGSPIQRFFWCGHGWGYPVRCIHSLGVHRPFIPVGSVAVDSIALCAEDGAENTAHSKIEADALRPFCVTCCCSWDCSR